MMKKLIIYMLMVMAWIPAIAQQNNKRMFNQRLFDAKVAQIAKSLNMTDEKKAQFTPIYKAYSEEMINAWNELSASADDEMEQMKQGMRRQERSQAIRLKYTDRFAKVLTPQEIRKFYKVENEIQRRLKERRNQRYRR